MKPQMIVKERMPAGRAAWMDTALYQARNIRSANCIIVNDPMLMTSGHETRRISAYPPELLQALDDDLRFIRFAR